VLRFVSDWLAADQDHLGPSLAGFTGSGAYDPRQLRNDLDRYAFLLGSNDGETLFGRTAAD